MFDGLIEILMEWLAEAWCWLLTKVVELATVLMQLVAGLMPDIGVPSWFTVSLGSETLSFIAWVFPTAALGWSLAGYIAFELILIVVLPLYRALNDLL